MSEGNSQLTVNFRSVPTTGATQTTPASSNEMEISSSRSNSPSDIENGSARDCIVHALTIDAINTTEPMTAFTLSITNGPTMATHG